MTALTNYPLLDPTTLPIPIDYGSPELSFTKRKFGNLAESTLAQRALQTDTEIWIQASDVGRMPVIDEAEGEFFNLTLFDDRLAPEIVYVVSVQPSGQLTVLRGQEGTGAREWLPQTKVRNTLTFQAMEELYGNVIAFDDFAQWVIANQFQEEQRFCTLRNELGYLLDWMTELHGDRLGGPQGLVASGADGSGGGTGNNGVDGASLIEGSVTLDKLSDDVQAALQKPGDIIISGSPERPSEFHLRAEGQLLDGNKYPELVEKYGTTYNLPGDPADSVRLPDYRHCVLVGASSTVNQHVVRGGEPLFGEFTKELGDYWGFDRHQLVVPELPNYNMTGSVVGQASGDIDVVTPGLGFGSSFFVELGGSVGFVVSGPPGVAGSPVVNVPIINPIVEQVSIQAILNTQLRINVPSQGQDVPHNNLQPSAAAYFWVFLGRPENTL